MEGEILSLGVALLWTFTAIFAEMAGRRLGALTLNVWRMVVTIFLIGVLLWSVCGVPYPRYASISVWGWFLASGFVGFVFGDYCLFNSYLLIGSRFGQLFMVLASPFAAVTAWLLLGERMTLLALAGMFVTMLGIAISILGRGQDGHRRVSLPLRGIMLGIGAALGQGAGLVLSKVGMLQYAACVPPSEVSAVRMMPFAGTMIRALMGLLGFGLALLLQGKASTLPMAWRDRRAMLSGLGAIILGPFLGVSLSLRVLDMTDAGVAQTLMSLTPVFILLPSHIAFGTRITLREVLGAAIAVCGASLFFL